MLLVDPFPWLTIGYVDWWPVPLRVVITYRERLVLIQEKPGWFHFISQVSDRVTQLQIVPLGDPIRVLILQQMRAT
jgi:hypothetical protein